MMRQPPKDTVAIYIGRSVLGDFDILNKNDKVKVYSWCTSCVGSGGHGVVIRLDSDRTRFSVNGEDLIPAKRISVKWNELLTKKS